MILPGIGRHNDRRREKGSGRQATLERMNLQHGLQGSGGGGLPNKPGGNALSRLSKVKLENQGGVEGRR